MKIAMIDLNHVTCGIHTNTVSLGIGLLSRYLQKSVDYPFDVKLFKNTEKALNAFKSWVPDVLGITQYTWNSELNLYIASLVKQLNPGCLVVAGGPNLDLSVSRRTDFLKRIPFIDICIAYDGEIPFVELIKRLISGETVPEIRRDPVVGSYSLDPDRGSLIDKVEPSPRLSSLDVFGSMYADGVFDEQLDDGFHPFVQTHRGCPFRCTFCHTSDPYYTKMLFLSPDIFKRDMEYLGKRFAGQHNIILYVANTNMSLFKQDFPIAEIIRETQEKYDWPRHININSGKDPKKLLEMLSIIKFQAGIALQTLTPDVLKNIKRKNLPFKDFIAFQHDILKKTGEISATELILCLPGETKETFLETLKAVLNSGIQNIVIYTLMNLKGTPLSSKEYADHYGHVIRHRVVPRQFSLINGKKVLDTEEVIVGTSIMPFEDYLELRGLSFTINIFFNSTELIPLKRLMLEYSIDIAQWLFGIHGMLSEFPDIYSNYKNFMQETEEELFLTRESLLEFFEKEENFNALCSGRFGDNLLRKYKCMILSKNYKSFLDLAISEAAKILHSNIHEGKVNGLLCDMALYLSTRDLKDIFERRDFNTTKKINLKYDIPRWLQNGNKSFTFEAFYGSYDYTVIFTEQVRRRFDDFIKINRDPDLSLQILYRDGSIRDFWPIWIPQDKMIQ